MTVKKREKFLRDLQNNIHELWCVWPFNYWTEEDYYWILRNAVLNPSDRAKSFMPELNCMDVCFARWEIERNRIDRGLHPVTGKAA
tara:strand:- start:81 stop:338 length:258 start_codon:yes stop_codon:yes gene_type:complete